MPPPAATRQIVLFEGKTRHGKRANEWRVSVVDCGSPLPLCVAQLEVEKRQRTAAVQNLAELSSRLSGATAVLVKPL